MSVTTFDEVYGRMKHGRKTLPPPPPPTPPTPPRVGTGAMTFGYIRVSTDRQASEGHSLPAQRSAQEAYAAQKGLGRVHTFVEGGVSGKVPFADRPAGAEMIARLRAGDSLLMTKIDRGFRNLVDFLTWFDRWQQQGISLHILDFAGLTIDPRGATGRLFVHMMAAIAQWEREANSERVRAAHAELRARGFVFGRPPRGFKVARDRQGNRVAVPDPYARRLMGQMLEWNESGQSEMKILAHLVKHNVRPPGYAKAWNTQNVHAFIRAERDLRAIERSAEEGPEEQDAAS